MFQFRRFPTYTYFVQCTLMRYCRTGFPHSEISGSMRMCRSPKLIAACRVLHRLLMPRHSPCALISLTYVERSSLHFVSAFAKTPYPLPPFSFSNPIRFAGFGFDLIVWSISNSCSRIMQAPYQVHFRNCNCFTL